MEWKECDKTDKAFVKISLVVKKWYDLEERLNEALIKNGVRTYYKE